MNLDKKARWQHYMSAVLMILGVWYVIGIVSGTRYGASPLADTTVDVTTAFIVGG